MEDDIDQVDEIQLFYNDLLALTRLAYRHDKKEGNNPSKKLFEYVKKAPNYGLEKTIGEFRDQFKNLYETNKKDIIDGFDDWIFKPNPILLKVTAKIYMPVGNIYSNLNEKAQDELYSAIIRTVKHFADPEDKPKLDVYITTKSESSGSGTANPMAGLGGIGDLFQSLMGGDGSDGLGNMMKDIVGKLSSAASNPDDPSTIDPAKIGEIVKELVSDQSSNSLISKMQNNPAIEQMAQKLKGNLKI